MNSERHAAEGENMIALLCIWLIVVVVIPVAALLLWKRKGTGRQFAVESVVAVVAMAGLLFLGPRSAYNVGRDTIHAFHDGRFQMWDIGDVGYEFSDMAAGSLQNNVIQGVLKWAETKDGCYLITKDGYYHFVELETGKHTAYQDFNDIPSRWRETFRKIRSWGPYGQLWEDLSHIGWRVGGIVLVLVIYFIRMLMFLFSFRGLGEKRRVEEK